MPDIVYDGKKVSVPARTNLVEAGLQAGVPVPVFCYHKELGAVGSCRVCAVTVTMQGKARTVMACMTDAQDGMEVTTLDEQSIQLRKYVLEWLMMNHPHDCPICDEGGECQLQDLTIAAGHGIRRFRAPKRTFQNQYLGEFIQHEMNRCITCYRCSRFYQEYAGGRDFGPTGSRDRVYFGRFEDGPLESPFSGNLVEMCPTGVFTDKLFRYKTRVWDLEIAHSVCPHCSVGCNVHPGARHRELQRVRVRENGAVNGPFLCDRGQFGHGYVMAPDRPREVLVSGRVSTWDEALSLASGTLTAIAREHGAASVALMASERASLETHAALEALASGPLAGARVGHFDNAEREARALAALGALKTAGAEPLEQGVIAHADVLVIAGTSLVDEAPLAALAARQAARRGARVFVLNAAERYLADVATRVVPTHPAQLGAALERVTAALRLGGNGSPGDDAATIALALAKAERPSVLVGSELMDGPAFAAGASLAAALRAQGRAVRFGCLFPGPNGFGAAALARAAGTAAILADLEAGKIRAAVILESDLSGWPEKAREALAKLDLLVVADHLASPWVATAHVFIPTTTTYESHGIYVNRAGRAQGFAPARVPGASVVELIDHNSFPRTPRFDPPQGGAQPAWRVPEALREQLAGKRAHDAYELRAILADSKPVWQGIRDARAGLDGAALDARLLEPAAAGLGAFPAPQGLQMFQMDRTLGSEVLSRVSAPIRRMAGPPVALISPADAAKLSVRDAATLEAGGARLSLGVKAVATVPEGVVLVPRDAGWPQPMAQGVTVRVSAAQLAEVNA